MKTILITGSSGFLGKVICNNLSNKYKIIAVDKMESEQSEHHASICSDITDFPQVFTLCETYKSDVIVHCAGIAHQKISF